MTFDRNHFWSELPKPIEIFADENLHHWNQSTRSKIMSFEREKNVRNGSFFYTYCEHWRNLTMMKNSLASKFDSMHRMICFSWLNWMFISSFVHLVGMYKVHNLKYFFKSKASEEFCRFHQLTHILAQNFPLWTKLGKRRKCDF